MKKTTKKNVILALLSVFAVSGAAATGAIKAKADGGVLDGMGITLNNIGAQVRVATDDEGGYGLRFAAEIDKTTYANLEKLEQTSGVSVDYGMLITARDMMTDGSGKFYDLTEANVFNTGAYYTLVGDEEITSGSAAINIVSNKLSATNEETGDYRILGSITSIKQNNLTREFVAKPYVKYTNGTTVEYAFGTAYTAENVGEAARSFAFVAVDAKAKDQETEATETWLQENVLDKISGYKYSVTHHYVDKDGNEIAAKQITETQTGKLGETVMATAKANTVNHEYDAAYKDGVTQATLYPNGKTALHVYYSPISLTAVEIFDSAEAAANVKAGQEHTSTYVDQAAVEASAGALPAIPTGSTGYVQIQNNEMNDTFKVHYVSFGITVPDCTVDEFNQADYIEMQCYLDSDIAQFSAMCKNYNFNSKWTSAEPLSTNSWVTIRYNMEWFNLGSSYAQNLTSLFSYFTAGNFFQINTGEASETGAVENLYVSYIKLVREEADESLGDKFIDVSETDAIQLDQTDNGAITWDSEKGALKIEAKTSYLALKFNTNAKMKNFSELSAYSKIRFVMTLPRWGKSNGTTPQVYNLTIDNVKTTSSAPTYYTETEITEGEDAGYYYVEMDMATFMKCYTYFAAGSRCILCQGNWANDAIVGDWYIKDIVCVK